MAAPLLGFVARKRVGGPMLALALASRIATLHAGATPPAARGSASLKHGVVMIGSGASGLFAAIAAARAGAPAVRRRGARRAG
jgi:heterodisulfide reductase subunit A-like polyferredoxin